MLIRFILSLQSFMTIWANTVGLHNFTYPENAHRSQAKEWEQGVRIIAKINIASGA